jgi:predicted acyltransferase
LALAHWRLPGVLQRIALVYLFTSLIVLHTNVRTQVVVALTFLLGYWGLLTWLPDPADFGKNLSPSGNLVRLVDQTTIGANHLYTQGTVEKTDPEGLLSTIPTIVTALLGFWVALFIQDRGASLQTVRWLLAVGATATVVGLLWGDAFPISKKLWTSSFVMLTAGLATIVFAMCLFLFDVRGWRRAAMPLAIVGVNAIFVYVASWIVEVLLDTLRWQGTTLKSLLYHGLFTNWIQSAQLASLAFAIVTVVFWWLAVWLMSVRGWKVTV